MTLKESTLNGHLVDYGITTEMIAETKARYAALKADTPAGYKEVALALREVSSTRTAVEKKRKQLKEDSLAWGRTVDAEAKRVTALILEIETPLKEKKDAVDNERQRKLDALKAEEDARLAAADARRHAEEEAKIKAQREAEAAANRAEADRLAKERAELAAERERHRLVALEQQQIADAQEKERKRIAQAEFERIDKERREKAAAEMQERNRVETARQATIKVEQDRADAERLERLKPDAEKLKDFAKKLREHDGEGVLLVTSEAQEALAAALDQIEEVAECLDVWGSA